MFHKAISMSGSSTAGWSVNRDPMFLAQEMAKLMGCKETKTSQQIYNCLKPVDGQLMSNHSEQIRVRHVYRLSYKNDFIHELQIAYYLH